MLYLLVSLRTDDAGIMLGIYDSLGLTLTQMIVLGTCDTITRLQKTHIAKARS